jgi:hypothetical protein
MPKPAVPFPQRRQGDVEPLPDKYVPNGQLVHPAKPLADMYFPGVHSKQLVGGVAVYVPMTQLWQMDESMAPTTVEYLPIPQ